MQSNLNAKANVDDKALGVADGERHRSGGHGRAAEVDVHLKLVPRPEVPVRELRVLARDTPPKRTTQKSSASDHRKGPKCGSSFLRKNWGLLHISGPHYWERERVPFILFLIEF